MCGCAGRRDKVDHQTTAAGGESTDSVPAAATAAMRLHVRRARRACVPRCAARISSNYGRWCARHAERAIIQTAQHASRARRRRRRCTHARANCRRLLADEQKQRRTPTGALRLPACLSTVQLASISFCGARPCSAFLLSASCHMPPSVAPATAVAAAAAYHLILISWSSSRRRAAPMPLRLLLGRRS